MQTPTISNNYKRIITIILGCVAIILIYIGLRLDEDTPSISHNNKVVPKEDDVGVLTKLVNYSLYCYFNSLMQILYHLDIFRKQVLLSNFDKNTFHYKLKQIFTEMSRGGTVNLAIFYDDLIVMFKTKLNTTEFCDNKEGCAMTAYHFILISLASEENNMSQIRTDTIEPIKNTKILKKYFGNLDNPDEYFQTIPYLEIHEEEDAHNIEEYLNNIYSASEETKSIPTVIAVRIVLRNEYRTYFSAVIKESIEVGGYRYKFHGTLNVTDIPNKERITAHYTARINIKGKWCTFNDEHPINKEAPKYDQVISGPSTVFYIRDE